MVFFQTDHLIILVLGNLNWGKRAKIRNEMSEKMKNVVEKCEEIESFVSLLKYLKILKAFQGWKTKNFAWKLTKFALVL